MSDIMIGFLVNMLFINILYILLTIHKEREKARIQTQKWLNSEEYKKFISNLEFVLKTSVLQAVDKYEQHTTTTEIIEEKENK